MVGEELAVLCYQLPGIRSDVVSVSVSGQCLVTGHRSGDVTLYSLRVRGAGGLQLTQTASRRVTEARDKLSVVSVDSEGDTLCVGTQGGEVIILQLSHSRVSRYSLGQPVTSLGWVSGDSEVCVGGESGAVALVSVLRRQFIQILDLGSKIVQIEDIEDVGLLVSSLTHSVLLNNEKKTFRHLGSKPRHGEFGACGDTCRDVSEAGGHVTWAARPGCRVWRVNAGTGAVTSTLQFKTILGNQNPVELFIEKTSPRVENLSSDNEHGFSLLRSNSSGLVLTYNSSNVYLLDLDRYEVTSWWPSEFGSIKEAFIEDNIIVTLHYSGLLACYQFGPVSSQIENIFMIKGTEEFEQYLNNQGELKASIIFLNILCGIVDFESQENKASVLNILRDMLSINNMQGPQHGLSKSLTDINPDMTENVRIRRSSEPSDNLMPDVTVTERENKEEIVEEKNVINVFNIDEDVVDATLFDETETEATEVLARSYFNINKTDILNNMVTVCQKIIEECHDNVTKEVSKLSLLLGTLLSIHVEENLTETRPILLVNMTTSQSSTIKRAFNRIFSDELFIDLCFNPLKDILPVNESSKFSFTIKQLVMMFEQKYLDRDYFLSSIIPFIYDFLDVGTILKQLDVFQYLTLREILIQDAEQKPDLSPLTLEQIEEGNVYDSVNLLSSYSILSPCQVLR